MHIRYRQSGSRRNKSIGHFGRQIGLGPNGMSPATYVPTPEQTADLHFS